MYISKCVTKYDWRTSCRDPSILKQKIFEQFDIYWFKCQQPTPYKAHFTYHINFHLYRTHSTEKEFMSSFVQYASNRYSQSHTVMNIQSIWYYITHTRYVNKSSNKWEHSINCVWANKFENMSPYPISINLNYITFMMKVVTLKSTTLSHRNVRSTFRYI